MEKSFKGELCEKYNIAKKAAIVAKIHYLNAEPFFDGDSAEIERLQASLAEIEKQERGED